MSERTHPSPAGIRGAMGAGSIEASRWGRNGPIIVLAYPHSGAGLLQEMLAENRSLTCTSGTGVVPLCRAALGTWRVVDGNTAPSPLAIKSVRALAGTLITAIQAGAGSSRWCEVASAAPEAADDFLEVFPETAFVCLHRGLPGVLAEGMAAYPWGLGGSPFWPFAASYPGNSVAAIAAYWAVWTEQLIDFEARHHARCIRVRCEDLSVDADRVADAVFGFLGLDAGVPYVPRSHVARCKEGDGARIAGALRHLPDTLRQKVSEMNARLGYSSPFGASSEKVSVPAEDEAICAADSAEVADRAASADGWRVADE